MVEPFPRIHVTLPSAAWGVCVFFGLCNTSVCALRVSQTTRVSARDFCFVCQVEEQRIEQWLKDWAEKAEERAVAHRKMLEAVLIHPDNEPEKALQKSLEVRKRMTWPQAAEMHLFGVHVSGRNIHVGRYLRLFMPQQKTGADIALCCLTKFQCMCCFCFCFRSCFCFVFVVVAVLRCHVNGLGTDKHVVRARPCRHRRRGDELPQPRHIVHGGHARGDPQGA